MQLSELACMHFNRARGGVFLKTFDDNVFDMTAVTVYTFKHVLKYEFPCKVHPL